MTSFNNGLKVNVIKGASAEAITSATISCLASKSTAIDKATEASASASTASAQASIATAQASIATTKANEASVSASASSLKANEASSSASSALTSKMDAATSEENALSYKNSASVSAATATNKASEASDSVDVALAYQYGAESAYNSTLSLVNNLVLPSVTHTVDTVDDFGTVPSGIDTVIVKDMNRGGTFIYDATQSAVNNGGTVFNGWVRQFSGVANIKWFNFPNVATSLSLISVKSGDIVETDGYYTEWDGGGAKYLVKTSADATSNGDVIDGFGNHLLNNGNVAILQAVNEINALSFGVIADATSISVGTDNSPAFSQIVEFAKLNGQRVIQFPSGNLRFTEKQEINNISGLQIKGMGQSITAMYFDSPTTDNIFLDLMGNSTNTKIIGIYFFEGIKNTCTCIRITDSLNTTLVSNWKNYLEDCGIATFKTGVWLYSDEQVNTTRQTHVSENTLLHCKINNCTTALRVSNIQAVNTTLVSTDIENYVAGENYTMIYDESGADIKVFGGSFIGRGVVYEGVKNPSYTISWAGGRVTFNGTRFELRADATEPVLKFPITTSSIFMEFTMSECTLINSTISRSLCNFASPVNVQFVNTSTLGPLLTLHQYPSVGSTAYVGTSGLVSRGSVMFEECFGFEYVLETSSAGGLVYNKSYSCPVRFKSSKAFTNGTNNKDAYGFVEQTSKEYATHGAGPTVIQEKMFVLHNQSQGANLGNFGFRLPIGSTPTKLVILKHPLVHGNANIVNLYFIKDVADWAIPGTLNLATDGLILSTIDLTAKSGYYESSLSWSNYYLASAWRSGSAKWLEGRLYISYNNIMTGFIGVKYI